MSGVTQDVTIRPLRGQKEIDICAEAMATSEPWLTLRVTPERTLLALSDASREIYVALVGLEVSGFIIINLLGPLRGYIQTLCVLPSWRNQGIGRQLIRFSEDKILREHANVFLFVSSFNKGAQRFYASLGYQRVGEVPDYIVKGHSEILLRKTTGSVIDLLPSPA